MSRVPPARSTRQGASDMIFMRKLYYTAGDIQNPWRLVDGCHSMRFPESYEYFLLAVLILPVTAVAQSQVKAQEAAREAMTASVDKQRASIAMQVNSVLGRPAAP